MSDVGFYVVLNELRRTYKEQPYKYKNKTLKQHMYLLISSSLFVLLCIMCLFYFLSVFIILINSVIVN